MTITIEEVESIAKLAKLNLSPDEKVIFQKDLSRILEYMKKLNELETNNVEPLSHTLKMLNVMREDKKTNSPFTEKALGNAPEHTDTFFKVPKVIR